MLRNVMFLAAIVTMFSSCCLTEAVQINSNWVGGESGQWNIASNWDPAIIPDNAAGNTFVVTIDANGLDVDGIDVGFAQSRTVDQLICNGVELEKWTSGWVELTLLDPNGLINHGELWCDELKINGNVINKSGSYMFLSNTEFGDCNFYNEAGATLEIETMVSIDPGSFTNDGWLFVIPAGDFWIDGGSFINNSKIQIKSGLIGNGEDDGNVGDFVNTSSGSILGSGNIFSEGNVVNEGTITALSGNLAVYADGQISNTGLLESKIGSSLHLEMGVSDFNNFGQIKVKANGAVTVKSGKIFGEPGVCTLNNESNATINLYGGALAAGQIMQKAGATLQGFGSITGDILIEFGAKIELTGPTNIVGDVNIPTGATLEISDGQTLITGHTTCDGTIHLIGGTVVFQGGCDCEDCNIINDAGIDRNHFDLNADGIEDFKDFAYFAETWLWQASWY